MGNLTSVAAKGATLPSIPHGKVKQLTPDNPDDLYIGNNHPQRTVVSLASARLPGVARKLPTVQQGLNTQVVQDHLGMDHQSANKILANNIVAKPHIPSINVNRHDYAGQLGTGGTDQSLTSRGTGHPPGSLPQVQQRGSHTSRPAYTSTAAGVQQSIGTNDAVRSAPAVETGPITPAQALKRYAEYLTPFEQGEILTYKNVWFLGKADVQKIQGNPNMQKTNYDDERGDYIITPRDHIAYRYEVLSVLGKGSFGQVVKVLDYKTGSYKALKIIRNKKRFHNQAQVELKVLEHLRRHDLDDANHVIHIQEHFTFRSHLCITFELLSSNLYEFIKQNNFAGLSLQLINRFAAQMLVSLRFLKQHKLIHCDLKPENVLLVSPQHSAIKVIDFGSSCFVNERLYTYVQSRFYRSPEVILGLQYGCEIDMWSFGCILAELFMGYPLFPGEDETEQLLCIMEIMGVPPRHVIEAASRRKTFFDANNVPVVVPNSRGKVRHPGTKTLWGVLRCQDPGFVDLLDRCLRWDPAERITPAQAMAHPWMQEQLVKPPSASSTYRQPATSRSRQDQAPSVPLAAAAGKLQLTSALGSGATAVSGAAALHGSARGNGSSSSIKAIGTALNSAAAAATLAATGPSLRSDVAVLAPQQGLSKVAAVVEAAVGNHWQSSLQSAAAAAKSPRAAQGSCDTVQSADCSPRQPSQTNPAAAAVAAAAAAMQGAIGQLIAGVPAALVPDLNVRGAAAVPGSALPSAQNSSRSLKHGVEAEAPGPFTSKSMKQQAVSVLTADGSRLHGQPPPQQQQQHGISSDGPGSGTTGSSWASTTLDASSTLGKVPGAQFLVNGSSSGLAGCLNDGMTPIALAAAEQLLAAQQQQQQQIQGCSVKGHGKALCQTQPPEQFAPASLLEKLLPRLHHR